MNLFEVMLYSLGIVILLLFLMNIKLKQIYMVIYFSVILIFLYLHIVYEPYRWYLIILYIAYANILIMIMYYVKKELILKRVTIITIVVLLLSVGVNLILPVPNITEDSNILIGTNVAILEDIDRDEIYNEEVDYRRIRIQYWYQASNVTGKEKAKWLYEGTDVSKGICEDNNLPSFFLNYLALVESNSYIEADMLESANKYPIVIISHGWRGFRNLHTDIAEELVRQGYFVVSIDHTYGSVATVFDSDSLALNFDGALPLDYEDPEFLDYANVLVNTYAQDVILTIDNLELMNATLFNDQLDLENIGLLGHSTGGGGDITAAYLDPRIKSVFGLDAWVEPMKSALIEEGLDIPIMFIRSYEWKNVDNNDNLFWVMNANSSFSSLYEIRGTTHIDFTMTSMFSSITKPLGLTGDLDYDYLNSILDTVITSFFDYSLKGDEIPNFDIYQWEELIGVAEYRR